MSRLFVCVVFVSLFVGCYPEPQVEPVTPTPELIERMSNATHADGSPLIDPRPGRQRRKIESER